MTIPTSRWRKYLHWPIGVPGQTISMTVALAAIGFCLVFQHDRWERTPAYHNLLLIMSTRTWGIVHLVIAAALLSSVLIGRRALAVGAHTLAVILVAMWDVGFIVRYLTDSSTTIVNPVSWSIYLFVLVQSAIALDRPVDRPVGSLPPAP